MGEIGLNTLNAESQSTELEDAASFYDAAAAALQAAAEHCRIAARHLRNREVPRGCAHGAAAYGHLLSGKSEINKAFVLHSTKAKIE
jgi:hypothetical protein